jgi:hypothetical protein
MKISVLSVLSVLFFANVIFAAESNFNFLKKFDVTSSTWTKEFDFLPRFDVEPVQADMSRFYDDFKKDGEITFFLGWGVEAYSAGRADSLFAMLQHLAQRRNLALVNWQLNSSKKRISFRDSKQGIVYSIDLGHERNEFQAAFENHEIMMYHGHSRNGRGPAFDDFQNYYRMGAVWSDIEVATTNPYFLDEPVTLKDTHPLKYVEIEGREFPYQYMGQKEASSHLPATSHTKNIEGLAKDLQDTEFLSGRQIFWLYSCRNVYYWKESLREQFSDPNVKFIFGTKEDGYWSNSPAAVFIMSVVGEVTKSSTIIDELNATNDCRSCFTSY